MPEPCCSVDRQGWLQPGEGVQHCPSPNFNARPANPDIRLIVLHNISLPPGQFGTGQVQAFFQNRLDPAAHPYFQTIADLKVSAHVLIERSGQIIQFVSFNDRAWHAGRSRYLGVPECNDYSIGIELEGSDDQSYSGAQYAALTPLLVALHRAYPHTRRHLAGHSDIAPGRKTDPGPHLDWSAIRRDIAVRMANF
jgi:AmpD protein